MNKDADVSPREAARLLGVSLYYIYQSLWAGKFPGRKVGDQWRIPMAAIKERLAAREEKCNH